MNGATFDALAYFEKLKEAGVPENQARIQAEALRLALDSYEHKSCQELATKADLKELEIRLLKWQIAGWLSLAAIMAKGFGWLGF